MSFRAQRIDHVEVFVRDIDAAAQWYRDVLGLEEVMRWHPEPVMIGVGGTMLALFRAGPNGTPRESEEAALQPGWHRVAWHTDRPGFEAAQKHLLDRGIAFRGPIDHGKALSIYFDDLDGHRLEITCSVGS